VFLPFSEREYEVDQIVFGRSGTGSGSGSGSGARTGGGAHEIVVQVLVRDGQESGKRRAIERVLEAWSSDRDGACELGELHGLASVMRPVPRAEEEVRSLVVIVHRMKTRLYL
jgi:elongator complex protein 5